jgi:hypothetical protein
MIEDSGLRATILEEGLRDTFLMRSTLCPRKARSSRGWSAWADVMAVVHVLFPTF